MAGYDMLNGVAQAMVEGMTMSQNPMNAAVIGMMKDNSVATKVNNVKLKADVATSIVTASEAEGASTRLKDIHDKLLKELESI